MKIINVFAYILLGLNQYRLTLALNQNTLLMEELREKLVKSEYNANILRTKNDLLEAPFDYSKQFENIATFLQNNDTLCLVLGLCGVLFLIYIGKGGDDFPGNVDVIASGVDPYGTTILLKPNLDIHEPNTIVLCIKPEFCEHFMQIGNISQFCRRYLELLGLDTSESGRENVFQRIAQECLEYT